jgi:predicted 3-demethylubiquinone-9 3-methyltransferase (glyoxalase superfamily)
MTATSPKNQVCLWYASEAHAAAQFYAATFPDTRVLDVQRAPADTPGPREGDVLMVSMTIMGIPTLLLNGGNTFPQSENFSFQVITEDQEETDRYWNAIVGNGGQESQCGWCKDKWGLSWQITPRQLMAIYGDPDPAATKRAMEAMFGMKKIDIAAIEAARAGRPAH